MYFNCTLCRQNYPSKAHIYQASHQTKVRQKLNKFHEEYSKIKLFLNNPMLVDKEWSQPTITCIFCDKDLITNESPIACYDLIEHFSSKSHIKKLGLFYKYQRPSVRECRRREEFFIVEEELEKFKVKCEKLVKEKEKVVEEDNELRKNCDEINVKRCYIEKEANNIASNNKDEFLSSNTISSSRNIVENSSNLANTIRNPNSIPPWLMTASKESPSSTNSKAIELGPNAEDFYKHRLKMGQIKRGIELVDNLDGWKPKFGGVFTLKGSRGFNRNKKAKSKAKK